MVNMKTKRRYVPSFLVLSLLADFEIQAGHKFFAYSTNYIGKEILALRAETFSSSILRGCSM